MKVYALVTSDWNCEYGYDEYSKPIEIFADENQANQAKAELNETKNSEYSEVHVIPYTLR